MAAPNSETCASCLYFDSGLCRRYAPSPYGDSSPQMAVWPSCAASDWCGDWRSDSTPYLDLVADLVAL